MNKILYTYLEREWRYCNHTKYQHYFKSWVNNLTESQIHYFNVYMNRVK
jgi:hypothetical protein